MIKRSSISLFKEMNAAPARRQRKKKKSLISKFHFGIKKLMKSLNQTEPYFVRCINPNKEHSKTLWSEDIVEHQLRCGGLIEALRVLSLGYPTRVPYQSLYEKYHDSVSNPLIKNMNPEAFSTSLLIAFDVDESDYELGLTKIFFKPAKADVLERIMSKAGQPLSAEQNAKITRFIVGKRVAQMMGAVKAYTAYKRMIRVKRATAEWREKGRVAAILGGTVMKHLRIAREQIRKRKMKKAALLMQTHFRGHLERTQFLDQKHAMQTATETIFTAYRAMNRKRDFTEWLDAAVERRQSALRPNSSKTEISSQSVAAPEPVPERPVSSEPATLSPKVVVIDTPDTVSISDREEVKEDPDRDLQREIAANHRRMDQASITSTTSSQDEVDRQRTREHLRKLAEQNKADRAEQDRLASERLARHSRKVSMMEEDYEWHSDGHSDDEEQDLKKALRTFHRTAAMGQLFYRHCGLRRRGKAQDRVVKVAFDHEGNPTEISWGKGSRHILWHDILYIAWGHWSPVFQARRKKLNAKRCLSIVAKEGRVLDLEGYNLAITELWVRGLRRLVGHSDHKSDEMAERNLKNLLESKEERKERKDKDTSRFREIIRLQQDLWIMSTHTVLRSLEEERIWIIDQEVRDMFAPQKTMPTVLKEDVPWRQWQQWLRERVTTYCRQNGKLNIVQPVVQPQMYLNNPMMVPVFNQQQRPIMQQQPEPVDPNGNCRLQ